MREEKIYFMLNEDTHRIVRVLTENAKECQGSQGWLMANQWTYIPTGKLSLRIEAWGPGLSGLRKKRSDLVS
jgi:hypothetical protein